MEFTDLSPQILTLILKDLNLDQLEQLCSLNPELNQKICSNESFWQEKYLKDFLYPDKQPLVWKEAYHQASSGMISIAGVYPSPSGRDLIFIDDDFSSPDGIHSISSGSSYCLILTSNGQVYALGYNNKGQLGTGNTKPQNRPTPIKNLPPIKAVSTGGAFSLVLTQDGFVYSFGWNEDGQLGIGNNRDQLFPTLISGLKNVKAISAGIWHSLVLTDDGSLYGFGKNFFGQLGLGDDNDRNLPTLITNSLNIQKIYTGFTQSFILTNEGQVYISGDTLNLLEDERVYEFTLIPKLNNVQDIILGFDHFLFIMKNGEVYGIGHNNSGQLGPENEEIKYDYLVKIPSFSNIKEGAADNNISLLIDENRRLKFYGIFSGDEIIESPWELEEMLESLSEELTNIVSISDKENFVSILTKPLSLYSTLETLRQNGELKSYQPRYIISKPNTVVEFFDTQGQSYFVEVYLEGDKFYPPKY